MQADASLEAFLALPKEERTLGSFRLLKPLGRGGFAPVWLATEVYGESLLRDVAIKLFALPGAAEPLAAESKAAIIAEARALCRVEHPSVVRFYSFARDARHESVFGLVMEYVRGAPLDATLRERGKLDVDETIKLATSLASALAAVHAEGIVHRDVKPANILAAKGVYKLIDFGIAKAEHAAPPARRAAMIVLDDLPLEVGHTRASLAAVTVGTNALDGLTGTIGYMDPACVQHHRAATVESDLYALGATLYECLTGLLPAVARKHLEGAAGIAGDVLDGRSPPPPLLALAPHVSARLAALIDQLLSPDPAARPRSAAEVLAELARVNEPPERDGATSPVPAAQTRAPSARGGWLAFGLLAIAGGIAAAAFALRSGGVDGVSSAAAGASVSAPAPAVASGSESASSATSESASAPTSARDIATRPCEIDSGAASNLACIPWCDARDQRVACCRTGLIPEGIDGICVCPPGGGGASGCPAPVMSADELMRARTGVVKASQHRLRACYTAGLRGQSGLSGRFTIAVMVSPKGAVFSARITDGGFPNGEVQSCALAVARSLRFPPSAGAEMVTVSVPFVFVAQ